MTNIRINLVISTYSGRYYKFDSTNDTSNKDKENYLKYNLLMLNNIPHNLTQITIMKPKINKEHTEIPNYYDFKNIDIKNIENIIKIYECENYGISYGQFFTAIFKDIDFDYYIFIEDDYMIFLDNFDSILVNLYSSQNNSAFLCGFINSARRNIFNDMDNANESISNKNNMLKILNKYNFTNYYILLPDFSLGILSKNSVQKLLITYKSLYNLMEPYRLKFNKIWLYQVLFGYTFNIAKIEMIDFNQLFLNIFYESSKSTLQLCNNNNFLPYNLPIFAPIDIFYPNNYKKDIVKFTTYLKEPENFCNNINKFNKIKKIYMLENNILNNNISICFYISSKYADYLPMHLYSVSLVKFLKKYVTNNVFFAFSSKIIREKMPDILFLFSLDINDVINYFHPNQIKYIINTEHISTFSLYQILEILNTRKNINFIEYNILNVNTIKTNFHNINCEFIPQLYHPYLIDYYKHFVPNKISFENKDIDVLFFGNYTVPRRQIIVDELAKICNVKLIYKTDDNELFNFIERSKIILNIYHREDNKPFDYYRNILLLANNALLVSEYPSDSNTEFIFEKNISEYLIVPKYENIIETILKIKSKFFDNSFISEIITKQNELLQKITMESEYKELFKNINLI
jgi:hypothetical protein